MTLREVPSDASQPTAETHHEGGTLSTVFKSLPESTVGESEISPLMEAITAVEQISGRVWSYRPGSWAWEELQADVRDFGPVQVISLMRSSGIKYPDGGQLVKFAHAALHPLSAVRAPKPVDPSLQDERAREDAAAEKRRKRREELDGHEERS
jgi:hypothetical protein